MTFSKIWNWGAWCSSGCAPSVQLNKVYSMCLLLAPPPCRNEPLQWPDWISVMVSGVIFSYGNNSIRPKRRYWISANTRTLSNSFSLTQWADWISVTVSAPFSVMAITRAETCLCSGWPSIWNGLLLSIHSLHRTFSQAFLSQLKVVLFGRAGVGSASE